MTEKHCPACRTVRLMEQPPCGDGHVDCPEWVCVHCNTAIVVGSPADDVAAAAVPAHAAA